MLTGSDSDKRHPLENGTINPYQHLAQRISKDDVEKLIEKATTSEKALA